MDKHYMLEIIHAYAPDKVREQVNCIIELEHKAQMIQAEAKGRCRDLMEEIRCRNAHKSIVEAERVSIKLPDSNGTPKGWETV